MTCACIIIKELIVLSLLIPSWCPPSLSCSPLGPSHLKSSTITSYYPVNCIPIVVPSGPPRNVRSQADSRSLTLWWSLPASEHQNGVITRYTVRLCDTGCQTRYITAPNTRITVGNLHPYTIYTYRIAASTSAGQGHYTSLHQVTTLQDSKCDIVQCNNAICSFLSLLTALALRRVSHNVIFGERAARAQCLVL
jgi:hypothetical protein